MSTPQENPKEKSVLREYIEAIAIALLLALFIRTFVIQAFKIPSGSMLNTLLIGDHILVNKFIYGIRNPFTGNVLIPITRPERDDIIVFKYPLNPEQDYIKRVVGVEGDKVEIIDKQVYINDQPYDSPHSIFLDPEVMQGTTQPRDNFGPVFVPKDSLFVMGDNRDNSYDSRFWKYVKLTDVKGKAIIIYWSWDQEGFDWQLSHFLPVRWNRIGKLVH